MFEIQYFESNAWHTYQQLPSGRGNSFATVAEAEDEIEFLVAHDAEHEDEAWEYRVREVAS